MHLARCSVLRTLSDRTCSLSMFKNIYKLEDRLHSLSSYVCFSSSSPCGFDVFSHIGLRTTAVVGFTIKNTKKCTVSIFSAETDGSYKYSSRRDLNGESCPASSGMGL